MDFDALSVGFSRDDRTVVLRVDGEVDAATAPLLERALAGVIDEQGNLSVQLDLRGTAFIDSTGLSVLVSALRRVRDKGGEMILANPQPNILRLFQIVGFTKIFEVMPTFAAGFNRLDASSFG